MKERDLLMASDVAGHAVMNNWPAPDTVMTQALDDFKGKSGPIKAMICKS